ncbi:hypothetical protein NIIDNTM18_02070 [Mycolicibacterium litorale]|uniref:Histidine kinase/HSP90-like ATPase domain-containing protein n=2 Tax=Mycolicibacterium litorale TaxID=758802 RepID=A0A6S6NXU0_9MYCO|nr:hypothetical protein NIIDNTM18_02070 [Mycolicibacterium litorale]
MRHCVNGGVAAIALAEPESGVSGTGRWLLGGVLVWALVRAATRSQRHTLTAIDFAVTLAVCLGIPELTTDPAFYMTNSAPQAIAGTAVVSFAVSLPAAATAAMTVAIAAAYATGTAGVTGWDDVWSVLAVYYFALQWVTASMIRAMLLRVAAAVDRARRGREAAQMARQVDEAVRNFEREQLALLHDTAASTLLMVGQGVDLPPDRLAAQAGRDLELLRDGPWHHRSAPVELIGQLRALTTLARTPAVVDGVGPRWVDSRIAQAVLAATREAINNVDRHARAGRIRIVPEDGLVSVIDDGIGFDPARVGAGHGLAESITARMRRAGGGAEVISAPGAGTTVVLRWSPGPAASAPADAVQPDGSIERMRLIYAWALTGYAVANLVTTVPYAVAYAGHPVAQIVLAAVAGTCAVLAVPACRGRVPLPMWFGPAVLTAVLIAQIMLLAPEQIGTQADWTQGGIGWCVVLWVLSTRIPRAAGILVGVWVVGGILEICRNPVSDAVVNVGLGTASILGVQLFALIFDGLMREAAADVEADVTAQNRVVVSERIARAVAEDYRRRYARLVDNVVPLLQRLSEGEVVSEAMQREARAESRRLRVLFDQSRTFSHPVMRRLRPVIDRADAAGVDVVVDVSSDLPALDGDAAEALIEPLDTALSTGMSSAHVVIGASEDALNMSVVCRDVVDPTALAAKIRSAGGQVIVDGRTVWVIVENGMNASAHERLTDEAPNGDPSSAWPPNLETPDLDQRR